MPDDKLTVSVVVATHHEGRMAHPTFNALHRSARYAEERGIGVEVIVVMDKPDAKTKKYFADFQPNLRQKFLVEFGDPGLSRNYGVEQASGEYVAFLDGDNLFCQNWLYEAVTCLEALPQPEKVIAHPHYIVTFEAKDLIWEQIGSTDPNFCVTNLLEFNYWDTVSVLKRTTARQYPFKASALEAGFYADDWEWSCRLLAAGFEHSIVPKTVYFRREKRRGSVLQEHRTVYSVVLPNELFQPATLKSILQKRS